METLVKDNNRRLEGIENTSQENAALSTHLLESIGVSIHTVANNVQLNKKLRDVMVYNEKGEILRCTNAQGVVHLGRDFSDSWNALNKAQQLQVKNGATK
jgi:hypothetical protein